ncbi:MAG TPA: M81 family metallopeptidase [Acidimicrobiia bacterium]|nr:M81 family metallopeptidase [Acidimicrobiia bacterium]
MERILVALLRQESHSFVPGLTTLEDFELNGIAEGAEVLRRAGNREVDGYLDAAEERHIELVPILDAMALSGPPVADDSFELLVGRLCDGVREHASDIDGVMLGLHGAMLTESRDDAEGEILARVRDIVGPDMPIAATFDLHTHMTGRMAETADIIVGYQTCPHVDLRRTGRAAMEILIQTIRDEVSPVISYRKIRMMTSSETHDDRHFPNREVIGRLHSAETDARILAATAFCTQPWLNVTELGWTIVVMTDDARELGQTTADDIARAAWRLRDAYLVEKMDLDEAIDSALAGEGLYALSEGADSTTAGGLGDGNLLLEALLRRPDLTSPCILMVRDAEAVAACLSAGIGAEVTTTLGGRYNPAFYTPYAVTGTVKTLTDGHYLNHYGGIRWVEMGPTAVLEIGPISVMITTHRPWMVDYEAYLSVGLDPRLAKIVQPKSAGAYREYYEPIATCIDIDVPGPAGSDLTALPYTRIPRPLWPWDDELADPWEE